MASKTVLHSSGLAIERCEVRTHEAFMSNEKLPVETLTELEAAAELAALASEIAHHDGLYHGKDAPEISDAEYDALKKRNDALEARFPHLVRADSPSKRVGATPLSTFSAVTHARPMFSIDNTYDAIDLRKWASRTYEATDESLLTLNAELEAARKGGSKAEAQRRGLREKYEAAVKAADKRGFPIAGGYVADPKVDGVAINLRYEQGRLVLAATRGTGQRGDDVTQNVRTIRAVPLTLHPHPKHLIPRVLEVRGEIYMPLAEFERMNAAVVAAGEEPFANPRNATAGTLKQLNSRIVAQRRLKIVAHGRGEVTGNPFATHSEFLAALASWGIPTNPLTRHCQAIDNVSQFIEEFGSQRGSLGYGVDGVVIRIDQVALQAKLGYTSKSPRW